MAGTAPQGPETPCDLDLVAATDSLMERLTDAQIGQFLAAFQKECNSDVGFAEYGNEVLFKVLKRYPEQTLAVLATAPGLDLPYLLKHLRNPLSDVDIPALTQRLLTISGHDKVKGQVVDALENAQGQRVPEFR